MTINARKSGSRIRKSIMRQIIFKQGGGGEELTHLTFYACPAVGKGNHSDLKSRVGLSLVDQL
jgi:hypothetical protein